jgi:hypothetical protein
MNKRLNPIDVAILYFKVLLATEPYQKYCKAKYDDECFDVKRLSREHPKLESIWLFWGDIFRFDTSLNETEYFNEWLLLNSSKFNELSFNDVQVIREGETITAKEGTIYYAISDNFDKHTAERLYERTKGDVINTANKMVGAYILKLNKDKGKSSFSLSKTHKYERAIDVIYWRKYLGLSNKASVVKAYYSKKMAWSTFKYKVKRCQNSTNPKKDVEDLDLIELHSVVRNIDRLRMQGEAISNSLLNDDFIFPPLTKLT